MKNNLKALSVYGISHVDLVNRCDNSVPSNVQFISKFDYGKGKAHALNLLIADLNDDDICFLIDADDEATPLMFERTELMKDYEVVYGDSLNGDVVYKSKPFDIELLKKENYIPYSSVMIRGSVLKNNPYPTEVSYAADWLYWNRLAKNGYKFHYEPSVVVMRDVSSSMFLSKIPVYRKLKRLYMVRCGRKEINKLWS